MNYGHHYSTVNYRKLLKTYCRLQTIGKYCDKQDNVIENDCKLEKKYIKKVQKKNTELTESYK